ncbi:MAG: hypothetical protein ACAH88_11545 [Roseimicrobium sp.]
MKLALLPCLCALLASSCTTTKEEASNATPPSATTQAAPSKKTPKLVILSPFVISDASGKPGLKMDKNGVVRLEDEMVCTIGADGTVKGKDGKLLARLGKDDMLVTANGEKRGKIDAQGTWDNGSGVPAKWSPAGTFPEGAATQFKIDPTNSPAKRAATIALILHLNF